MSGTHRARSVGIGHAHAKAILLGEHAVVYGAPALALPIPQLTVTASAGWMSHAPDDLGDVSFTMTGSPSRPMVTQATESLRRLITEFKAAMGVTDSPHLDVIIDGAIPHGRGLGSSAACARAVVFALADLFGREVTESVAFDLVQTAENVTHGRSSGVDARAVGASAPLLFQAGETQELSIGCDGLVIIADSGVVGRTKDAVEQLRAGFQRHSGAQEAFVRQASELTDDARRALADGRPEELGSRLTDYHELLRAAGLSTKGIDALVKAALTAGSLGAKITGAGTGGCVITLTQPERASEVTRQLHGAGAVQTWVVPLRGLANHRSEHRASLLSPNHPAQVVRPQERSTAGSATAVAHPNIALIKYWGKRDERLVLPWTDSLSMTLDIFPTTTRVRLAPEAEHDAVTLDGAPVAGEALRRVIAFLELVRDAAGLSRRAVVDTENTVPTGAGLASSASGFAALAVAAAAAYGLDLDATALSRLARRGSGSASRSIFGGFAIWNAGRLTGTAAEADLSSYAEPVPTGELDPALVIVVVNAEPKAVSSRVAMRRTVDTSPLYQPWAASSKDDLADMRGALRRGDLDAVGEIAERNALGMHATMLAARPAVRYMSPATLSVLDSVLQQRRDGISAYATMDAGPNVKVLCHRADADQVAATVRGAAMGSLVHIAGPGQGARLLKEGG